LFIDINYDRRPKDAKLHLSKPNKTIISHISEKFNTKLSIKLGNINELNFSIPYYVEEDDVQVYNKHIDMIKEKMLIKVSMGDYIEWFVVEDITENGDDKTIFNVKAFSLGYELKRKLVQLAVSEEEQPNYSLSELMTELLSRTSWTFEIDTIFDNMVRSFESNGSTVLEAVISAGETFGALIVWDTENRIVRFKDMKDSGKFRGLTLNYGRLLNSIEKSRTSDEMVTRMYVYGNEDLTINAVNPTGQSYIEDFTYFMHPFERSVVGETVTVLKSSDFMSDELCNALLDYQLLIDANQEQIENAMAELSEKNSLKVTEDSNLSELESELFTANELLTTAQTLLQDNPYNQANIDLVTLKQTEKDNIQAQVNAQQLITDTINNNIISLNSQIDALYALISKDANFTQDLIDELDLFVIEKEWRDDKYIDEYELYQDSLKKFEELRQPKVVIEANIDNILDVVEEQYYWDKLYLGDLAKVKYTQMKLEYMAKIIQIDYDVDNRVAKLIIANNSDLLDDNEKLVQLLYNSKTATTLIENNKYKWDKVTAVENTVSKLITDKWDATKQQIIAGVNNSVEIDGRGVVVTNPYDENEIVVVQNGVIALSGDKGETWRTAIKASGIVAEQIIGHIILGDNLSIANANSTFSVDKDGIRANVGSFYLQDSEGRNVVDNLTTRIGVQESIVSGVQTAITPDAIANTVINSTAYINEIGTKLGEYQLKTDFTQTSKDITAKISSSSGINILKNSIGFSQDVQFKHWVVNNPSWGTPQKYSVNIDVDNTVRDIGFEKAFYFPQTTLTLTGGTGSEYRNLYQTVNILGETKRIIKTGSVEDIQISLSTSYTLSWHIKKSMPFGVTISGDNNAIWFEVLDSSNNVLAVKKYDSNTSTVGYEFGSVTFDSYLAQAVKVRIRASNYTNAVVTGLMFNIGSEPLTWSFSNGETYNTNTSFDIEGIRVTQIDSDVGSLTYGQAIGYTEMTTKAFAGYYDKNNDGILDKVFWLDKDETHSKKLVAEEEIILGNIKIVTIDNGTNKGWGFVPVS
jgi:hypothetical protein